MVEPLSPLETDKIPFEAPQSDTDKGSPKLANPTGLSISKRLQWELSPTQSLFSLQEPSVSGSATIDVVRSFVGNRWISIPLRFLFLALSLQVLYYDLSTYPPHNLFIYCGYLTHWGHLSNILYLCASWLCSLLVYQQDQQPNRLVKWTWCLYSTVAPLGICITLLYWSAVNNGPVTYVSVMEHGGLASVVLFDGLVVGLVPIRVKQVVFLMTVCICYFIWSIVDAVFNIGNGEWGPAYDDDALYPVLNWKTQSNVAAIVSAFSTLILAPTVFFTCWMMSLASPRTSKLESSDEMCCKCCCRCFQWDGSRRPLLSQEESSQTSEAFGYKLDVV